MGSSSVVGYKEMVTMNRVIVDLPDHPQNHVPDKPNFMEVLNQAQSSMDPEIHAQFVQLLCTFS